MGGDTCGFRSEMTDSAPSVFTVQGKEVKLSVGYWVKHPLVDDDMVVKGT